MGVKQEDEVPNTKEIVSFCHCSLCVKELQDGKAPDESPESYARLSVGMTRWGLQVWCVRHDCNVLHMDFEGKSPFPSDTSRKADA
jgi:hypothetical protein